MNLQDQNASALRQRIIDMVLSRELPVESPLREFGGPGSGSTCCVCLREIALDELEYESADRHGLIYHFHVRCHELWRQTSRSIAIFSDSKVPSPGVPPPTPPPPD